MRSLFKLLPLVLLLIGCPTPPPVVDGGGGGGSGGGSGFDAGCGGRIGCACVAGACTTGECIAGTCTDCVRGAQACVCRSNGTCDTGLRCAAMNLCETCPPGANGCPCNTGSTCDATLTCAAGTCIPASCVDGRVGCSCRATAPTCDGTAYCDGTQRCQACSPDVLQCPCNGAGQCLGGLVCNAPTTTCRNPRLCTELADAGTCKPNQACSDTLGADGTCITGQCTGNFKWDATSMSCVACAMAGCPSCVPDAGFAISCATQHRACMDDGTMVSCASCLPGYALDSNNNCVGQTTCGDAGTCGTNQFCDSTANPPSCVTSVCPAGFAQFIGTPPAACGAGGCSGDCSTCCAAPCTNGCGECKITCSGPGLSGRIWPQRTTLGACVCETLDGWLWQEGGARIAERCDDDNDGWVRDVARASNTLSNPALLANARCNVRTVDRVRLVDEYGSSVDVVSCAGGLTFDAGGCTTTPLPLLETARNDVTAGASTGTQTPAYPGTGARRLAPWELNSLTKACIDTAADYDHDTVEDIKEVQPVNPADPKDRLRSFAYFVELYTSYFEPVGSPTSGRLVIRERSRCDGRFPLRYDLSVGYSSALGSTYWRNCERGRDPSYFFGQTPVPGFDFAQYGPPGVPPPAHPSLNGLTVDPAVDLMRNHGLCELAGRAPKDGLWRGMNHHSQFKCVNITNLGSLPWQRPSSDIGASNGKLTFNECTLPACTGNCSSSPDDGGILQTGVAPIACAPSPMTGLNLLGRSGFVVVNYRGYGTDGGFTATWSDGGIASTYAGGCVNEDTEYGSYLCPYPEFSLSRTGDNSFGRYSCGENSNFLWCDTPCDAGRSTFYFDMFKGSVFR